MVAIFAVLGTFTITVFYYYWVITCSDIFPFITCYLSRLGLVLCKSAPSLDNFLCGRWWNMGDGCGNKGRVSFIKGSRTCDTVSIICHPVQNSWHKHWDVFICLCHFNNHDIPLPGSGITLRCDNLFTWNYFCLSKINMIIPINCWKRFSYFVCSVAKKWNIY